MPLAYLTSCLIHGKNTSLLQEEFILLLEDCRLSMGRSSPGLASLPNESGCYLWIVRDELKDYCVYVGQTNSIRRRAGDYSAPFQMHSPNDFKLRIFEEQLRESHPEAKLSLFFKAMPVARLFDEEKRLISSFLPAINRISAPDERDREVIKNAYRAYYLSALRRVASNGT